MKKSLKLFTILAMVVMMVALISVNSFAAIDTGAMLDDIEKKTTTSNATNTITDKGGQIIGIVSTIGMVAAVIILMIIGVKYMMGSASEKAEYKKVMIPYIVGAVLLFAAGAIVKMLSSWNLF